MLQGIKRIPIHILGILMGIISLIPLIVLIQLAFSPAAELTNGGILSLHTPTLQNFFRAFERSSLPQSMLNSLIITFFSLLLTVVFSAAGSYEIARFPTRTNRFSYMLFIFSMAIPAIVSTVPLYILMRKIGAINSLWGMILLNTASSMPFAIFLYTSFIRTIPREMEEAALIDGCSWFGCFRRIVFPLLKPVTSTVILLNAVTFWNEYGRSVFFLQKQSVYTMPLSISMFIQKYGAEWDLMAAAALIAMIPTVAVFLIFQKYYIKGLAAGAVKG